MMADTTSMFVVGLYHYFKWTGDQDTINRLWPAAKRAMAWVMVDSTKGLFCFTFRYPVVYFCFGLVLYSLSRYILSQSCMIIIRRSKLLLG